MYFLGWKQIKKKPRFLLGVGALTVSLGFLIFLNFRFWKILNSQQRSSLPVLSPVSSSFALSSNLEEAKEEELFLTTYSEEELVDFRDLFRSMIPIVEEIKEEVVVVLPEEYGEEAVYASPQEFVSPQEEVKDKFLPPVHLQGIVVSDSRQAVIVEVGGKIQILTNEKTSSSNIKLIKVEDGEVVLNYEGREITLTFEK